MSHLDIWTLYDNPSDYPGQAVARRFEWCKTVCVTFLLSCRVIPWTILLFLEAYYDTTNCGHHFARNKQGN